MPSSTTIPQQSALLNPNNAESAQTTPNSLTPKLRKGAKSKYIIEEHPIMDGAGKVVRTRHTGDTFHCFFYVKDEKKWLRKSLHTKKLEEAKEAGRKLMMLTLTRLELGERIFSKTYEEVVEEFLKEKQEEVVANRQRDFLFQAAILIGYITKLQASDFFNPKSHIETQIRY